MDLNIALAKGLHTLAAVIWVGGMFFAYMALRPVAATLLQPVQRLPLWAGVFAKFFIWVWCAILLLPATGFWMVFHLFQDMSSVGLHVHIMTLLGIIMILLFLYLFFIPYLQLRLALLDADLATAGKKLAQIRVIVGINLVLGLVTVVMGSGGRYLF
ncbi:MAG: hypothetical protein FD130_252 [Halothiobacillaceae bacterium]|nr:MAG: hypothetical protein FD130_252 [Halothiobacillaceae bacterium]